MRRTTELCVSLAAIITGSQIALASGTIRGDSGGYERQVAVFDADNTCVGWKITGGDGLYEFSGLAPGRYMMHVHDNTVPFVQVDDGHVSRVDFASQLAIENEFEVWMSGRVSYAQSFVATGTAVLKLLVWRANGQGRLAISLFEESLEGKRIAGPWITEKDMSWVCTTYLPADEFKTTPGKRYVLEMTDVNKKPWAIGMPRVGDVQADGFAYYDGVPHPESDLGITVVQQRPGPTVIARADWDLHFIAEGPGSGYCRVAGQTFVANTRNVLRAYTNCGWSGAPQAHEFIYSIREDGPDGKQVGPSCRLMMRANWGNAGIWRPTDVELTPGKTYYLEYRRSDNKPFFSYLSKNLYDKGRAYRDGEQLPERFDQWCEIIGETEPGAIAFPYDISAGEITPTSTVIRWRTGIVGDSLVTYWQEGAPEKQIGSRSDRTTDHAVRLTDLEPATVYRYWVSSDTHKTNSHRFASIARSFLTSSDGKDTPTYVAPREVPPVPMCDTCIAVENPSFEDGLAGWQRISRLGRPKNPETFVAAPEPFGRVGPGVDGYSPHSGDNAYGWSCFASSDSEWREPREDWKQEIVCQDIAVEPGREYVLGVWLLTGDRGRGWGRSCRIRLAVDEEGHGRLEDFDTIEQANITQWFATLDRWQEVKLRFKAKASQVSIGVNFLHWWALEASHLYVDDISVRPAD